MTLFLLGSPQIFGGWLKICKGKVNCHYLSYLPLFATIEQKMSYFKGLQNITILLRSTQNHFEIPERGVQTGYLFPSCRLNCVAQ